MPATKRPADAPSASPNSGANSGANTGANTGASPGARPDASPGASAVAGTAAGASKTFTITELAREFDITPRAIRFYEDVGLLEPARAGRNRVYTHRDRTRLKLTLRGKRLGLSLSEIKQLVDMYDSEADTAPQLQAFMEVLRLHRGQLEQQLDDIRVMLAEIAQHEERCRSLLVAAAGKSRRR